MTDETKNDTDTRPTPHAGSPVVVVVEDPQTIAERERFRQILETTREAGEFVLSDDAPIFTDLPARNPRLAPKED